MDTYTLNVASLDPTSYKEFIDVLREVLPIKYDPPVLPVKTNPIHCFDLELSADSKVTTVRFRKHDLYVIGYQAQASPKNWYELPDGPNAERVIDGSVFLGYSSDYNDMGRVAGKTVTQVSLTQQAFYTAVSTLANSKIPKSSTFKENQERAKALILIAQMVSEACRFVDVSDYLASVN